VYCKALLEVCLEHMQPAGSRTSLPSGHCYLAGFYLSCLCASFGDARAPQRAVPEPPTGSHPRTAVGSTSFNTDQGLAVRLSGAVAIYFQLPLGRRGGSTFLFWTVAIGDHPSLVVPPITQVGHG